MDDLIIKKEMVAQYKSPEKKQNKRKSAGLAKKTKSLIKEKFRHYDLFTFKKKSKILENCRSEENDSNHVNVMPKKEPMEFDSPDKTEILGNVSCSEQDFKIEKKPMNRKVSSLSKDTLIMDSSQYINFDMSQN
ncbi:unnamed protein product [Chironomus riparius]|uniref:Uncharacterized protein n=1 Tax=Chironomus riparius TaxID=315576 RepID=A0A9P0J7E5_9DIPT|nr:unnamed protein product [Chironomus riparius]